MSAQSERQQLQFNKKMANKEEVDPFAFMLEEVKNQKPVELADQFPGTWHSHFCRYRLYNCQRCKNEREYNIKIDQAHKEKYGTMKRECWRGGKCDC